MAAVDAPAANPPIPWTPSVSPWLIAATVMLATFMEVLDTSIANVSLPHIAGSLSATVDESTWVLTSYLISNAIVLPLTGWLSMMFGRKRLFIGCVIIFTISSFLCGLAPNLPLLIFFRILQGAGGGGLQPISQAILVESFSRKKQGMAMAVYGMGVVVAPIIGPTLGGWITDSFSWRWIFFINVPVGVVAILMTMALVEDPPYMIRKTFKQGLKIDFIGLGLLSVGLGFIQVMLDKGQTDDWFESRFIVMCGVIGVLGLAGMILWELRQAEPLVDLRLFTQRNYSMATFMMFAMGVVMYGTTVLLPILLQTQMGYTAEWAGLVLSPGGLVTLFVMPLVGRLLSKYQPRWLVVLRFHDAGCGNVPAFPAESPSRLLDFRHHLDHFARGHAVPLCAHQRHGVRLCAARENQQRHGIDQSDAQPGRKRGNLAGGRRARPHGAGFAEQPGQPRVGDQSAVCQQAAPVAGRAAGGRIQSSASGPTGAGAAL